MRFEIFQAKPGRLNQPPCKAAIRDEDAKRPVYHVEINTLEELMALCKEVDSSLIIEEGEITVYNYYVE